MRRDALPFRVRITPLSIARFTVLALVSFCFFGERHAFAQDGAQIHWKSVDMAQVRVDGKTPLKWNVYQPDKRDKKDKKLSELILVLLGHRYLMVDARAHEVYVVPLASLHAQGADFASGDLADDAHEIPTTDWTSHDVGPAQLYKLTLGDYNHVMEVSIPHPPDLRAFY